MARGRMISKSLSTSEKFAALVNVAGDLAEFCQALYPLIVTHSDDFGRLQGDAFTVKMMCFPASPRPMDAFVTALQHLHAVDLIVWYDVEGKRYIQIEKFERHQQGLHRRTRSAFPRVPGISGNEPELLGQEKRRELKRTQQKIPPTPLAGGRLTRAERKLAKEIRSRRMGCTHEPRCHSEEVCLHAITRERKAKAS